MQNPSRRSLDHMMAKIQFTRENYPKNFDIAVDMHPATTLLPGSVWPS